MRDRGACSDRAPQAAAALCGPADAEVAAVRSCVDALLSRPALLASAVPDLLDVLLPHAHAASAHVEALLEAAGTRCSARDALPPLVALISSGWAVDTHGRALLTRLLAAVLARASARQAAKAVADALPVLLRALAEERALLLAFRRAAPPSKGVEGAAAEEKTAAAAASEGIGESTGEVPGDYAALARATLQLCEAALPRCDVPQQGAAATAAEADAAHWCAEGVLTAAFHVAAASGADPVVAIRAALPRVRAALFESVGTSASDDALAAWLLGRGPGASRLAWCGSVGALLAAVPACPLEAWSDAQCCLLEAAADALPLDDEAGLLGLRLVARCSEAQAAAPSRRVTAASSRVFRAAVGAREAATPSAAPAAREACAAVWMGVLGAHDAIARRDLFAHALGLRALGVEAAADEAPPPAGRAAALGALKECLRTQPDLLDPKVAFALLLEVTARWPAAAVAEDVAAAINAMAFAWQRWGVRGQLGAVHRGACTCSNDTACGARRLLRCLGERPSGASQSVAERRMGASATALCAQLDAAATDPA